MIGIGISPFFKAKSANGFSFGAVTQYLHGVVGNEMIDISGNGYNADIINNDLSASELFLPYKSKALIAQKVANFGLIPDPNNFWFTAGVPNQIPVTSLFQNVDYLNRTFCKHDLQTVDIDGIEVTIPAVVEIVTYASALTGASLVSANSYFGVPAIDTNAKWIDPVNGNDTTGTGTQAAPYKLHSKVNGLTLTEGILVYVKTGSIAPIAWNKNYQIKTIGFTKILSSVGARGIDYDPAGTLAQEINGYRIDMANVASSVGINCNSTVHSLTLKKLSIVRAAVAGIQSVPFSTTLLNVEDCVIDNTNQYAVYSNKYTNINNSLLNSSQFCIYKDNASSTTINVNNSKVINSSTPLRLYSSVIFNMVGGLLQWASNAMISSNASSGGERNFNGVNIKYTGVTVGGFIITENQAVTKLDIRNSVLECPNLVGAIGVYDINGTFNFINNIAYKVGGAGFGVFVYEKNYAGRSVVVNISNNVIRNDDTAIGGSSVMTIGQDPHPYPNKVTGVVEKNHLIHMNDTTAHGFIVLYENAGVTVKLNKFNGLPVNGFKCNGESYILNVWKYNLMLNSPLLAKGVHDGYYYNNTIVINQYMADSAHLISIGNNAVPGPTSDSINCKVLNHIVVYTGTGSDMNMVRLDHTTNQIDYNIYYNKYFPCTFLYLGVAKTFAQWQALGFDTHSVVLTDAQYEAMFNDPDNGDYSIKTSFSWPITGFNTGKTTGIDAATTWGDDTVTPNVITKEQPANYNIGAYIQ